jgi:hypothetical protein
MFLLKRAVLVLLLTAVSAAAFAQDPNCNTNLVQGLMIPGYVAPNGATQANASNAIARLMFADIWRLPPFRITENNVRLDVQGAIAGGGRNWQAQVGPNSIAHANIVGTLAGASTVARRTYIQRVFRNALVQSLADGHSYTLTGNCN